MSNILCTIHISSSSLKQILWTHSLICKIKIFCNKKRINLHLKRRRCTNKDCSKKLTMIYVLFVTSWLSASTTSRPVNHCLSFCKICQRNITYSNTLITGKWPYLFRFFFWIKLLSPHFGISYRGFYLSTRCEGAVLHIVTRPKKQYRTETTINSIPVRTRFRCFKGNFSCGSCLGTATGLRESFCVANATIKKNYSNRY